MFKYGIVATVTIVCFIVYGCSSPSYRTHSSGKQRGYYKVGTPYQIDGRWYYPKEDPHYIETGIASWYGQDFHGKKTANGDVFDKNALTAAHRTLPMPSMVKVSNLENGRTLILMVNDRGPFAKNRIIDVSKRAADILGFKAQGTAKVKVEFLKAHTQRLLADFNAPPQPYVEEQFEVTSNEYTHPNANTNKNNAVLPDIDVETGNDVTAPIDIANTNNSSSVSGTPWKATNTNSANIPYSPRPVEITNQAGNIIDGNYIQAGAFSHRGNAETVADNLSTLGQVDVVPVSLSDGNTLYKVKVGPISGDATHALNKVIDMGYSDAVIVMK